jgi:hypothetical protein
MAEMQQRYGKLWVIGRDGPWWGDVVEGVHRLANETHANAVKYSYVELRDAADRRIELGDARVSLQVRAELIPGSPHAGAGLLYRFDREKRHYAALLLSLWGNEDVPTASLSWAVSDEIGFSLRQSQAASWIDLQAPIVLAIEGHGSDIALSANGRVVRHVREFPRSSGDPGVIAVGRGRFAFDDFTIWPPSGSREGR